MAVSVVLMTGCVRFEPKPVDPARVAADFDARSLSDAGLKMFMEKCLGHEVSPWPVQAWTPDMLTLAAMYYHPDMDLARARWGVARAASETAAELPNPTISVAPGYNTTTSEPSPWFVSVNVDFPIETANKRGYRMAGAGHNAEAAKAGILGAAWQVRSRVVRSLLDYVGSNQAADLLRQQQASREQIVKLMELQQPQGNIPPTEVTQARIALRSTRLAVLEAQRQSMEAKVQLADALGLPVSALQDVRIDLSLTEELPEAVSPAEARKRALTGRADVLASLAEYAASQAALQLEIARQYPDIHLGPGYEYDQGDDKWSLGVSLTLPVFNQNRGAIREAGAKRTEAAMKFAAVQAKIIADVDRAVLAYEAARLKLTVARELLTDVQKQRKAAEASFKAGDISKLELTAVELELQTHSQIIHEATLRAHQAKLAVEESLQQTLNVPDSAVLPWPRDSSPAKQR
jgi:outer membrane protein, heavy metal efflux system